MKKLTFLIVMLLLGSGITKAFIWNDIGGYPSFTFWKITNQQGYEQLTLNTTETYKMYFYFSCKYDITILRLDLELLFHDIPLPLRTGIDCGRFTYLPKKAGDYIEMTLDFNIPSGLTEIPDSLFVLTAKFKNQDSQGVAAGAVPICITKRK